MLYRMLRRLMFLLITAAIFYGCSYILAAYRAPSLHEQYALPLLRTLTPQAEELSCPASASVQLAVAEPYHIPEAEKGDIFGFMYHDLTENEDEADTWTTTPDGMRSDLLAMAEMGYLPLSIEDYIEGEYERGQDYYLVTFDDGYLSNMTLAEPLLAEMGVPASVFVITSGTDLSWHMSWEDLAEVQKRGVISVYTHTHNHLDAEHTDPSEFLADTEESWDLICTYLSEPMHQILSYPGGAYTRETMEALAADGYDLFVIQNRPAWYTEDNAEGILVLVRMNVAYGADMTHLVNLNRERNGFASIEETLAARDAADAAARQSWLAYSSRPAVVE